jgi:transposase
MALALARGRPEAVAGDKGYSSGKVRAWIAALGALDVVPTRSDEARNEGFDKGLYRGRNVVERCLGWLKECRRVATRYEKLAANYLGMVKIAMIRRLI